VVQLLLTLRCDVTLADEANATPFDWAVQGETTDIQLGFNGI